VDHLTCDDVADRLGTVLGGTVQGLQRLSGGASRITSSFDLVASDGTQRPLILQRERGQPTTQASRVLVEADLLEAAGHAGVPVPEVVAAGKRAGLDPGWLVVERLEGESIPRKLLRDPEWAEARRLLTAQCGAALAAIHAIDPNAIRGLPPEDPLSDPLGVLDELGEIRPTLELGARWLAINRPPTDRRVTVHGDFRMGNLLVGTDGLRAVLDWELAHAGDPAEDIGWLCSRAWRFGGTGRVGGFGQLPEFLESYAAAGGVAIDIDRIQWWEVYAAVKWAVICALQASVHLRRATRTMELAAIGRRVCESEWDLLILLGLCAPVSDSTEPGAGVAPTVAAPFGRPSALELVEAVREHLETTMERSHGEPGRFEARIGRNILRVVEREMVLGPAMAKAHSDRLATLGFGGDASLAASIRSGAFDDDFLELGPTLAASTREQLLVANPSYLSDSRA
jgi:aminoglycoside phosphotransferase (APT) family kinase protein